MVTPGRIVAQAPIHTVSATSMGPPVNQIRRSSVSTGWPVAMKVTWARP